MAETGRHKIFIAGRWEIRDLYEFPHRYAEIYAFLYALEPFGRDSVVFAEAFQRYPWRGGYSAVNFYDEIYLAIPRPYRPHITRIQYSSPGFLELGLLLYLVTQIDEIIAKVCKGFTKIDKTYTEIHARAMKRRLLSLSVREREQALQKADAQFVIASFRELSDLMGMPNSEAILRLTGDSLGALKILMAVYRRVRLLVEFVRSGKVKIELVGKHELPDEITE
jgi:hypothetical protein